MKAHPPSRKSTSTIITIILMSSRKCQHSLEEITTVQNATKGMIIRSDTSVTTFTITVLKYMKTV